MKRLSRREFVKWSAVAATAMSTPLLTQADMPINGPAGPESAASGKVEGQGPQKQIAMLLYPGMTALDLIAPQMIFSLLPTRQVHLVAKTLRPVETDTGVILQPDLTFEDAPEALEVLFVPGGLAGTGATMQDDATLTFLRERAATSDFVTSVCTGSLILGAAGLLRGYRATTHWTAREVLPLLGAELVTERIVEDRNRVTAGGVTSGIDFALSLASRLAGEETARALQLAVEYAPKPPFHSGTPEEAAPETVAALEKGEIFKPFVASLFEAARAVRF